MKSRRPRYWISSIAGAAVIAACSGGVVLIRSATGAVALPSVTSSDPSSTPSLSGDGGVRSPYVNGRYQVTGRYLTPGGDESIGVIVDLTQGSVTAVQVQTEATSPTARQFQDQFRDQISARVVARDIAGLAVDRIAGASLTSVGFNDALDQIRLEADQPQMVSHG